MLSWLYHVQGWFIHAIKFVCENARPGMSSLIRLAGTPSCQFSVTTMYVHAYAVVFLEHAIAAHVQAGGIGRVHSRRKSQAQV